MRYLTHTKRLQELAALEDGWADGDGFALDAAGTRWVESILIGLERKLSRFSIFPTIEGNISVEFTYNEWSVDIEFNLREKNFVLAALRDQHYKFIENPQTDVNYILKFLEDLNGTN